MPPRQLHTSPHPPAEPDLPEPGAVLGADGRVRAVVDDLTGLANRSLFLERLRDAAARGTALAVLFLDLDDFKLINDGWGHETGDRLLVEVAERLRRAVRPGDLVARLGGDEFTVLCEGVSGEDEAVHVARRLRDALAEPFTVAGHRRHVRVSIGCRVAGPWSPAESAEALLRDADVAMYQAKDHGKDHVELYSEATRGRIVRRLELEQELRAAVEAGALDVHYSVARTLERAGVVPGSICLELTESALMGAGDGPLEVLGALKALGVYIAIDARRSR